jgi:hypothetical protein
MWERLGRIVAPPELGGWARSHASVPFVRAVEGDLHLFYSTRDERGRSHTVRAGLDLDASGGATAGPPEAVLGPGALGAFDDSGAMGAWLVRHGGREHLYYIGWSLGVTVPFYLYIGLAVSEDGGRSFTRASRAPVVGRSDTDPLLATAPCVLVEDGLWRMWYTSAVRWEAAGVYGRPKHYYRIAYAESADGVDWRPTGRVCIDFANDDEYAIGRPCVVRDGDGYHMWFSCRGSRYRIGYARSADGLDWQREDRAAGLLPAGGDWESESVEYGFVLDHERVRWLLYNGNNYGATGIGLARWDGSS